MKRSDVPCERLIQRACAACYALIPTVRYRTRCDDCRAHRRKPMAQMQYAALQASYRALLDRYAASVGVPAAKLLEQAYQEELARRAA